MFAVVEKQRFISNLLFSLRGIRRPGQLRLACRAKLMARAAKPAAWGNEIRMDAARKSPDDFWTRRGRGRTSTNSDFT